MASIAGVDNENTATLKPEELKVLAIKCREMAETLNTFAGQLDNLNV